MQRPSQQHAGAGKAFLSQRFRMGAGVYRYMDNTEEQPEHVNASEATATDVLLIPPGYIPALDGVRGLAILLVMLHHFTSLGGMTVTSVLDKLFYKVTYAGWAGVNLFFVLSGFLITRILYD